MQSRRAFLTSLLGATLGIQYRSLAHIISPVATDTLRFLVVGDWGTGGKSQKMVATAMKKYCLQHLTTAVISTGDNFYPSGVASVTDKQWKNKFVDMYGELDLPWYAVLGNHDYRLEPDAQVEYSTVNSIWNMPARYFHKKFTGKSVSCTMFFADTQGFLQNINRKEQITYFTDAMSNDTSDWKVLVGHHPMRSGGHYGDNKTLLASFGKLMEKYGVQSYWCGHDHDLQLLRHAEDSFTCLVSGSGAGTRPTSSTKATLCAHSVLGFASVECVKSSLTIKLHSAKGEELCSTSVNR